MRWIRFLPISTVFLSIFPVVSLLAHNIDQIRGTEAIRALVVSFVGSLILVLIYRMLLHDWYKATLAGSLSALLFFSYGHIYGIFKQINVFNTLLGRHRYLAPLWLIIFAFGLYWIIKRVKNPTNYMGSFNLIAVVLTLLPLLDIASFEIRRNRSQSQVEERLQGECNLTLPADGIAPDVYYIILDAYAREDSLLEGFEYDNSTFLDYLRDKGFYIAEWSQANYMFTFLSLASSLNMNYLENLDERITPGAPFDAGPIYPFLGQSILRKNLECLGYKVVTFDSGFYITGWLDADIYISSDTSAYEAIEISGGMNAFESMLLRNSAALLLIDAATLLPKFMQIDTASPFQQHYDRMIFLFDALEQIAPSIEGPKFVFAHILTTHTPYVIGPDGEFINVDGQFSLKDLDSVVDPELLNSQYQDQVTYLNGRLEQIIDEILSSSKTPPIIVIQSDHGPENDENRLKIFNTYYLPKGGNQSLYDSISPVNSFRIILNTFFGGDYELLDDLSYASTYNSFDFWLVPNPHAED